LNKQWSYLKCRTLRGDIMSTISHTNIIITFLGIILDKRNTIVDKQEVSLCAIQMMFVQIVFRLLRNKNLCYPNTMFSMVHIFSLKVDTHLSQKHTHTQFSTHTFLLIIMDYLPSLTTYVAWGDRQICFLNRVAFIIH